MLILKFIFISLIHFQQFLFIITTIFLILMKFFQRLNDTRDDDDDEPFPNHNIGPTDKVSANILLPAPPLRHRHIKWKTNPTWLISGSELKHKPPKLQFHDLSLHLLNQGHGPAALVTIREIDNESEAYGATNKKKKSDNTLIEDSKCGIIGRILTGIRICILKVINLINF